MARYGVPTSGTGLFRVPRQRKPAAPKIAAPRTVAPRPWKPPADPLSNPTEAAVGRLGTPLSDEEIQAKAKGMLSPLVQQITDAINQRAQAGTSAIGGYTSSLAKALSGYQQSAANIYGSAQAAQQAADTALADRLTGGGQVASQQLSGELAAINAPGAVSAAAGGVANTGAGAGTAAFASGSAELARLIAQGAAEQSYAAKLPGFAGLMGGQQLGNLQGQLQGDLADQLAQVQSQVPGLVSGLESERSSLLGRQETLRQQLQQDAQSARDKHIALQAEAITLGGYDPKTGMLTPAARKALSRLYGMQIPGGAPKGVTSAAAKPTKLTIVHNDDGSTVAVDPTTGAVVTQISGPGPKSTKPTKPITFQGTDGRTYILNPKTGVAKPVAGQSPAKPLTKPADVAKAKRHGLSAGQYQEKSAKARGWARLYHKPQDQGGATWQQYLTAGEGKGVPAWILIEEGRKVYNARERKLNTYAGEG